MMDENKTPENEAQEVQKEALANGTYIADSKTDNIPIAKKKKLGAKISCVAIIGVAALSALAFALGTLLPNKPF